MKAIARKHRSIRPIDEKKMEELAAQGVNVDGLLLPPTKPRKTTINMLRFSKATLLAEKELYPEDNSHLRPKTRGECIDGPRPCPWVGCRHHLYLDAESGRRPGNITITFPDTEPEDMEHSCSLDIADEGPHNLQQVGNVTNVTRERVRQIEVVAKKNVKRLQVIQDIHDDGFGWEQPESMWGDDAIEMTQEEGYQASLKKSRGKKGKSAK